MFTNFAPGSSTFFSPRRAFLSMIGSCPSCRETSLMTRASCPVSAQLADLNKGPLLLVKLTDLVLKIVNQIALNRIPVRTERNNLI